MSDREPSRDLRSNLRRREAWVRVFYVVVFAFIIGVAFWVVWAVVLLQVGWSLIAGSANANLARFGAELSDFVGQVLDFLTYHCEHKPFPFAPWPASARGGAAAAPGTGEPSEGGPFETGASSPQEPSETGPSSRDDP